MEMSEDITRLYALVSTQNFLLNQLYARFFAADPAARQAVPKALIDAATFRSHTKSTDTDQEALVEMQAQVVQNLRHFFADVELRVQQFEASKKQ